MFVRDVWHGCIDLFSCCSKEHLSGAHLPLLQPLLGSLTDFLPTALLHLSLSPSGLCTQWTAEVMRGNQSYG